MVVPQHKHAVTDFPTGNGADQIPLSSSLRTNLLLTSLTPSGTVANTAVLTALSGTGSWSCPANTGREGEIIEYEATGTFGATADPTLAIAVSVGGTNRGTATSGVLSAGGNWKVRVEIVIGDSNTAKMTITVTIGSYVVVLYDDQGFDPTIANAIALSVQWSAGDPGNTTTQQTSRAQRWAPFTASAS